MLKDLRYGIRLLLREKGWSTIVILSLALGIGANTALFSAVNGLLLRKIPVRDPDSLVRLRYAGKNDMATDSSDYGPSNPTADGTMVRVTFSYPMFQQFRADNHTMSDVLACAPIGRVNLSVDGVSEIATASQVTGNYFQMLGVPAIAGRTLAPDDDKADAAPVAVIAARFWRSRFGGDPATIGRRIAINGVPLTIVGVIASDFTGIQQVGGEDRDITVSVTLDAQVSQLPDPSMNRLSKPTSWWLQVVGRLKPDVTAAQVQADLDGEFRNSARAGFDAYLASSEALSRSPSTLRDRTAVPRLIVDSASRGVYDVSSTDVRSVSWLGAVVALVLLIVCANVANLLLSRAANRAKEISVRLSLGASRPRLVRQLLTESLLLAAIGAGLGIAVAHWGQPLLPGAAARPMPIDWRVLSFVMALATLTAVVFGILPALRATRLDLNETLKQSGRGIAGSKGMLGKALLVFQVAVSLVLLVGAGLFLRTLQNLRAVDVGFNPNNLVLARINPRLNRYDDARVAALYVQLLERLKAVPGVSSVALSQPSLLSGSENTTSIFVEGQTYDRGARNQMYRVIMSPGMFETLQMPLLTGRDVTERDGRTAPKVAVINETAAKKYFGGENPVGRRFGSSIEQNHDMEVVGVVRDARYNSLRDAAPPTMYVPFTQSLPVNPAFEVRTAMDPAGVVPSVREMMRRVDPNVPIIEMSTQVEQIERRVAQEKAFAGAYAMFSGLALLLAAIGLFGLMSYSVARRTNEIGIRMALGAQPRSVLGLVLGESLRLVALGVAIGVGVALAAGRLVTTLLFGVAPADPNTLVLAIVVMTAVSVLAGFLPARRASRVDPLVALRYE
jgi:predicted permease